MLLAALLSALAGQAPMAWSGEPQIPSPGEDSGTETLGQLEGRWSVRMEIVGQGGTWHPRGQRLEWRWYHILDRQAIQDDYIAIDEDEQGKATRRVIGTNIRIYNGDQQQWHMAWISAERRRLATFTAVNEGGRVVMRGRNDQDREVRNTFFDIGRESFDWVQEWTFDDGVSWVPVARIHATRLE